MENNLGLDLGNFNANAAMDQAALDQLNKSMTAGYDTSTQSRNVDTPGNAGALIPESLENQLKVLTYGRQDIKLWNWIPKDKAFSTVEDYNTLDSYATNPGGGFIAEGGLPDTDDTTYIRRAQLVKFMGETREVSHQATLTNVVGVPSLIQAETKSGMLSILRKADVALAYGNSAVTPLAWDGLYKQHVDAFASLDEWQDSPLVIDLKGKILRQEDIEAGSLGAQTGGNFALIDTLFAPPAVLSDFGVDFFSKQRILLGKQTNDGFVAGGHPKSVSTTGAEVQLNSDVFLSKTTQFKTAASPALGSKAPATPTPGGTPAAAVTDASNRFLADGAGDYFYYVTAVNNFGESAPVQLGAGAIAVAATESVDLQFTITDNSYPATGYKVYRSEAGSTDGKIYEIISVSLANLTAGYDGGAAGFVRDRNRFIAGTEEAFALENSTQTWNFKQLAPLMKMDLARLATSYRFMVLLYGTPILYAPKRMVRFINVGKDTSV